MRSVWSGTLAFGLVSIPVKLGSAVSSHKISFRQIHLADQGRVRYQKTCELDEEVLTSADIGRAFETPDDQLVEVTDADLQALPLPTAKTIEVSGFVEAASVDAMQLDTPYFLAPSSPTANKPYVLMREALARSGKAAVGKFAMRNSEHLALITARDDILLLQTLRWPDELNSAADAVPRGKVNISDNELQLADTLIEALGEADLSAYHDEYAAAVEALVTAKLEGAEPPAAGGEGRGGQVVDLMSALQASVDQAKDSRGGGEGRHATVTELSSKGDREGTSGKRTAKKAAKKTAAKKTAARKTAAKKPAKKAAGHRKAN
ncbi:non-homologous end joining protein Ku [Actinacidiphila bryophytorum]|uniref:Non-homologous end joining protein Ku n=1 Tax=Actinacidiphila bryophytorum TaxID=1436133 RepID=A0A9W4GXM9_9ACTN|nr:Ku protein [Actinacidiphila bryophytorum]MBM9439144.1 Ku protein [Actinacidiphila bryophytorum]MBN6544841.1 Ku protein [Actinacidiphila bryophytorum]CAG7621896.1 Non-homologous end joining protein Ku [Actinacidiphila bryophytorum]